MPVFDLDKNLASLAELGEVEGMTFTVDGPHTNYSEAGFNSILSYISHYSHEAPWAVYP